MILKSLIAVAALALTGTTAYADGAHDVMVSKDGLKVSVPHAIAGAFIRDGLRDHSLTTIFSNIGTDYPKGLYFCCFGDTVSGPNSGLKQQIWIAGGFTPASGVTATRADVGLGYIGGAHTINIGIYSDASGLPGTALISKDVTVSQTFGGCCGLATLKIKRGVALSAGTQYWVVVSTDTTNSDAEDSANFNSTDEIDPEPFAFNAGSGWVGEPATPQFSFDVLGK